MFQTGTVMRIKTTGESVTLLGDVPRSIFSKFCGQKNEEMVTVRRPVSTQTEGVRHLVEEFYICELDTVEENINREFQEVKIRQRLVKGEELQATLIQ